MNSSQPCHRAFVPSLPHARAVTRRPSRAVTTSAYSTSTSARPHLLFGALHIDDQTSRDLDAQLGCPASLFTDLEPGAPLGDDDVWASQSIPAPRSAMCISRSPISTAPSRSTTVSSASRSRSAWEGPPAFVSAGGYHHHIGLNTWESYRGQPPAAGTTGLYHFAIRYGDRAALGDALRRLQRRGCPPRRGQ